VDMLNAIKRRVPSHAAFEHDRRRRNPRH
jgi:hypothetical protein